MTETGSVKNTPLTSIHTALGAKMAAFAGYNMPISYAGIFNQQFLLK
jgi:aminomethyltransferase